MGGGQAARAAGGVDLCSPPSIPSLQTTSRYLARVWRDTSECLDSGLSPDRYRLISAEGRELNPPTYVAVETQGVI